MLKRFLQYKLPVIDIWSQCITAQGSMPINLPKEYGGGFSFKVYGGPYSNVPKHAYGVSVRAEHMQSLPFDIWIPIVDFGVPSSNQEGSIREALRKIYIYALGGEAVYIGCMGGIGRTGLFMALLAKVAGEKDPVAYVRSTYSIHAVETDDQQKYVNDFDVSSLQTWLKRYSWKARRRHILHRVLDIFPWSTS